MKNNIKRVFNNWKKIFCFGIIFLSCLLILVIFIVRPMKLNTMDLYDSSQDVIPKEVVFPIEQDIHVDVDNVDSITIFSGESNLNDYRYQIELKDEAENLYFFHDYEDYSADFMYLYFGNIPNSKGKTLHLKITCDECQDVFMDVASSKKRYTNIENDVDSSLKITMNYYTRNYGYFWYSILGIVVGLVLFILAKEETVREK